MTSETKTISENHELPVRVYSPEPLLGHPITLLKSMGRDLLDSRELAWRLFIRDLSAQYRQTYLGYVWAFLPPLFAALTFIFLNSQGIVNIDTGGVPYPAFAMMGTLLWQVFVDALQSPGQSLQKAKTMLAKINFPREAILLGGIYMVVFNLLVRLVLLAGVMTWWKIAPSETIMMFPVAMVVLLLAGFCVGLALLPISGLYGDISRILPMITSFWMLLTPVVYPARETGLAGILATWNPVSPPMVTARESISGLALSQLPEFAIVGLLVAVATLLGMVAFRLALPHLIARMGD